MIDVNYGRVNVVVAVGHVGGGVGCSYLGVVGVMNLMKGPLLIKSAMCYFHLVELCREMEMGTGREVVMMAALCWAESGSRHKLVDLPSVLRKQLPACIY